MLQIGVEHSSLSGDENFAVKILLYDRDPRAHYLDIAKLEKFGLCWHKPGDKLPDLSQFEAVLVHASDDKNFKQNIAIKTIENGLLLVVFSGNPGISADTETLLKNQYPTGRIYNNSVHELRSNIEAALTKQELEELCWDRLSDVLEVLSTLWALGLHWEQRGTPSVVANSNDTFSIGPGGQSLLDSGGTISLSKLGALTATNGKRVSDLAKNIYRRIPQPNTNFAILAVATNTEYRHGVELLRDSLLAWARSPQ